MHATGRDRMATLDTSFLVAIERRSPAALKVLREIEASAAPSRVPAAVWTEYLSGMTPAKRARAVRTLEGSVTFEPFDRTLADEAARLQHELRRAGATLGWHDLQIATTALHYGEPVVSNDEAFDGVPGLERVIH